jgi:hypothetical protein
LQFEIILSDIRFAPLVEDAAGRDPQVDRADQHDSEIKYNENQS